jgi:hypothetical protein
VKLEILSGGLLAGILNALERVSVKVRFHLGMMLLAVADVCDQESVARFLKPPGCQLTVYRATLGLLAMENYFIFERILQAWDKLFVVGGAVVIEEFFGLFPGKEVWEAFAIDDDVLEPKADAFLSRWIEEGC